MISQHIFMFPFRITSERPSWAKWERKFFDPKLNGLNYSEFSYFHSYVRDALYEFNEDSQGISKYYELKGFTRKSSSITYFIQGEEKSYTLDVDNISLRKFETGVGILSFSLLNNSYDSIEDILIINDFGRRVYPQFIPENGDISVVKNKFLPDKVVLNLTGFSPIEEDFFDLMDCCSKDGKISIGKHVTELLGDIEFVPIIDDRMYTLCWYGNERWSRELSGNRYESSDEWYQYIFLDGKGMGCGNDNMKTRLIRENTYERWSDYGTLYGITRYSMMCLTDAPMSENSIQNSIRNHLQTMYFQMSIVLLAQRASILKFSADISKLSKDIEDLACQTDSEREKFNQIAKDVEILHASFIRFANRLWFSEVTAQEQGIEMYNMALKNMGLTEQMNELREEVKELYEFVEMQYEKFKTEYDRKMNHSLFLLNKIAFILLPLTVVFGLLGMSLFSTEDIPKLYKYLPYEIFLRSAFWQRAAILIAVTIIVYGFTCYKRARYEKEKE
ncbi:MAG: hypothetical protein HGA78_02770 [Nitrospirales bacterium]|nr:hypothetical protein [Nitrospirales bacterium]